MMRGVYYQTRRRRTDPGRVLAWMILAALGFVLLVFLACFGPAIAGVVWTVLNS